MYKSPPTTKLTDKFLGYCAVTPNKKFMKLFERAEVRNVLVSYHYIRKNPSLTQEMLRQVRERGGLFMTDSGAFSFLNDPDFDATKFNWEAYVEEYVEWLDQNKKYIFSACNMDVDLFVGHDAVLRWNRDFFEKIGQDIHSIYVAHPNVMGKGRLDAFKEYCKQYDYVAVNEGMKDEVSSIYQTAKITKTSIHGLAWTKPSILDDYPFFSVDSSSWVNYQKFGATPVFDGTNFKQYDNNDKSVRTTQKNNCAKYGVKFYEYVHEVDEGTTKHNDDEGLTFSLRTWMDVFDHVKKFARTKLTKTVGKMLEGKVTEFNEAPDNSGKKKSSILGAIEAKGISSVPAIPTTYQVDEDGSQVALYQKRETKIAIADFLDQSGDALVCNFCHIADKCPKFKEDSTCAFDFTLQDQTANPVAIIDNLIRIQSERVNRAMLIEKMEGGNINKVYSLELRALDGLNQSKMNILAQIQNRGLNVTKHIIEHTNSSDTAEKPKEDEGFRSLLLGMMQNK